MKALPIVLLFIILTSCARTNVQKLDPSLQISHVCIQTNPQVAVQEFLPVVRRGFDRHGITTEVFQRDKPKYCKYHLTYTALRNWDLMLYMHFAELQLYYGNKPVAYAKYDLLGMGGLDFSKWASVESKMNPIIDELLSGFSPETVDLYRKAIPSEGESAGESGGDGIARLRELKEWFNEGLITEQEYNSEKQKVLNQ